MFLGRNLTLVLSKLARFNIVSIPLVWPGAELISRRIFLLPIKLLNYLI